MFRKSLQILIATTLLVLAAVVGYAALGLGTPKQDLADAVSLIERGQFATAIAKLDLAGSSPRLQANPELQQQLWRLRYDANYRLGNAAGALPDIENLLTNGLADDEALRLDYIRLLAMDNQSERAVLAAKSFLQQHPGHSRGLELAGETCQSAYQPQLIELRSTIEGDVPSKDRDIAREALFRFLYRPAGDRTLGDALARLAAIYQKEPRLAVAWPPLAAQLQALRTHVQEALDYFRQSLEAGGEPVAAFRGFALALELSERTDDLLFACEIQRRRFQHSYVEAAGATAAWALQQAGLDDAAIATVERWLPKDALSQRLHDQTLGDAAEDLLLAEAVASFHRGTVDSLRRAANDLWQIQRERGGNGLAAQFANALNAHLAQNEKNAETALRGVCDRALRQPPPFDRPDPAALCAPLALDWMAKRAGGEADSLALLASWKQARPTDITPHLLLADFLLARGRTAAARNALQDAAAVDPNDERVFLQRVATMRRHLQGSAQDGPGLVQQCLARGTVRPEASDPIGFVLCAETALEQKLLPIAAASARDAVNALPSQRLPRLLEIRAAMAQHLDESAAQMAARLLQILPADAETATLNLEACRGAGLPMATPLAMAMSLVAPSDSLQQEVLRQALRDTPQLAPLFVTPLTTGAKSSTSSRILASEALARSGDPVQAAALLDSVPARVKELTAAEQAELARAFTAGLEASAASHADDDTFLAATDGRLSQLALDAGSASPPLLHTAKALAATHPRLAHLLCERALANADPETRDGQVYGLAGRLALAAGCRSAAEQHWIAALAFADGRDCVEDLARLCLVDGRSERAQQVYAFVTAPTDAALAARCAGLSIAAGVVSSALTAEPADLLAQAVLSTYGMPSLLDWQQVADPQLQDRLDLLTMLREPAYAAQSLQLARAVCTNPGSTTDQLLLAHALAMAGHADEAAKLHDGLLQRGTNHVVFWHEVAFAGAFPGYQLTPQLRHDLYAPETLAALAITPNTLAFAMNTMADSFTASGHPEVAANLHMTLWLQAPSQVQLTAADITQIVRDQPAVIAFDILDKALAGPHPPAVDDTLPPMFTAARAIARNSPERVPGLYERALALLQQHGPVGSVVHFVLEHEGAQPTAADLALYAGLLRGHLARIATGGEDATWLPDTLRRLVTDQGTDATLLLLGDLVHQHPTALALWHARARLAAGTPGAQQCIDDLRHVLQHTTAPEQVLAFVALAAETRRLTPVDIQQFEALPAALRTSPAGHYATGLVRLRQGRAQDALAELAAAAPAADGMHLFAQALAWLQSPAADGCAHAIERLDVLQRDYPSSSLARYAGSFSLQLAPR